MPPRSPSHLIPVTLPTKPKVAGTTCQSAHLYFSTSITLLWVLVLSLGFGLGLVLMVLSNSVRLARHDQRLTMQRLDVLQNQLAAIRRYIAKQHTVSSAVYTGALGSSTPKSPSGALSRGSLSPDGKKYAGYEDVLSGKLGLSLEMLDTGKLKRLEIFNPLTESTGADTPFDSLMSVRWKDQQTIEYDVLVKRQGVQKKETRNAKIFF